MKKLSIYIIYFISPFLLETNNICAQSVQQLGPNYFSAGIPTLEFYAVASIGQQRCPEWCWAASCQMILNYHGLYVTQEQIVTKIFGTLVCQGGTPPQISDALTGWAPNTSGTYSGIYCQDGPTSAVEIVNNLAYKWPLLVCLKNSDGSGHAEVLTAVYYSVDEFNIPIIDKVILRDPWPYNPSQQEMSWYEFTTRLTDIFKVWVVRI